MAVLARVAALAAVVLAGCYDPALRDCTVTCHAAGDCASGQVCGTDGFCAAASVAGTCRTRPDARETVDTRPGDPDAAVDAKVDARVDARVDAAPPDAPGAQLHILITNKGKVVDSTSTITCLSPPGDCLFGAEPGTMITLTAVASNPQHAFDQWTDANCMGQPATCTVTIVAPVTTVNAKFK